MADQRNGWRNYDIYWEKGDFTVDKTHQNRLGSYLYAGNKLQIVLVSRFPI